MSKQNDDSFLKFVDMYCKSNNIFLQPYQIEILLAINKKQIICITKPREHGYSMIFNIFNAWETSEQLK